MTQNKPGGTNARLSGDVIRERVQGGDAALLAYLPLGFPTVEKSIEAAKILVENGVDIIELGFPYSDPAMDGPVIQEATREALATGTHLEDLFDAVAQIKETGAPVVSMTYWNPVHWYGVDKFSKQFKKSGGAGLITPDLPPEEAGEWKEFSDEFDLERVFLAALSSSQERLETISKASSGWVYAASAMGVTGERAQIDEAVRGLVSRCRDAGAKLVCVGIGVSDGEQARDIASYADGVIVGSAFVRLMFNQNWEQAKQDLAALARQLKAGVIGTKKVSK